MFLSPLALDILRASAGEIVSLPYHDRNAMAQAKAEVEHQGLIVSGYDDDQPTSIATQAGYAYLAQLYAGVPK